MASATTYREEHVDGLSIFAPFPSYAFTAGFLSIEKVYSKKKVSTWTISFYSILFERLVFFCVKWSEEHPNVATDEVGVFDLKPFGILRCFGLLLLQSFLYFLLILLLESNILRRFNPKLVSNVSPYNRQVYIPRHLKNQAFFHSLKFFFFFFFSLLKQL